MWWDIVSCEAYMNRLSNIHLYLQESNQRVQKRYHVISSASCSSQESMYTSIGQCPPAISYYKWWSRRMVNNFFFQENLSYLQIEKKTANIKTLSHLLSFGMEKKRSNHIPEFSWMLTVFNMATSRVVFPPGGWLKIKGIKNKRKIVKKSMSLYEKRRR